MKASEGSSSPSPASDASSVASKAVQAAKAAKAADSHVKIGWWENQMLDLVAEYGYECDDRQAVADLVTALWGRMPKHCNFKQRYLAVLTVIALDGDLTVTQAHDLPDTSK